jgi:hypothetical protein
MQLQRFLGDEGYYWLSACAVYPEIHWGITVYLGYTLTDAQDQPLLTEERLLALVRLPWFRYGSMPDWLRLRLISALAKRRENAIRSALDALLLSALQQPQNGFPLIVAHKPERLKSRRWKRLLHDFLRVESEDSPLRDYVFLAFLSGRKLSKLAVTLPGILRHIVFRQGQTILGIRPAIALTIAAVIALLGWEVSNLASPPTIPAPREVQRPLPERAPTLHIGDVVTLEGVAEVRPQGHDAWVKLHLADPILPGDTIRTGSRSQVQILLRRTDEVWT